METSHQCDTCEYREWFLWRGVCSCTWPLAYLLVGILLGSSLGTLVCCCV